MTVLRSNLLFILAVWALTTVSAEDKPSGRPAVGDVAKDFELVGLDSKAVKLSELNKNGPVVILVLRGWPGYQCPLCTRQVGQFLQSADKIKEAGASVVLIYPGPKDDLDKHAQEFVKGKSFPAHFRFVTDPDYAFTNAYNLRWDAPNETAYPSTFVVDKGGKISFAKISMTHGDRSSVNDVLSALKK
jgi:thioredoxin-dependent peroxiredoxin